MTMSPFTTVMAVLHGLGAIFGIGVLTALPFLGMTAEKQPASTGLLLAISNGLHRHVVWPAAVVQLVTGIILIVTLPLSLTHNVWLGASIVIFVVVFGIDMSVQAPLERRLLAIFAQPPEQHDAQEIHALTNRIRAIGGATGLGIMVIAVLMIWHPGLTVGG